MEKVYRLLLLFLHISAICYAGTYNRTLQVGETITISDIRPGTNYQFANDYDSSNQSVAGVSIEQNGTTTDKIPSGYNQFGKVTSYLTYIRAKYKFVITGLQSGTTSITLGYKQNNNGTLNGYDTYIITVVDVKSITIPASQSLQIGDTYTFSPIIIENGATTTLTWQSSNPAVATINSDGTLSTKSIGTTTIVCTAHNGVSAQCEVTVNPVLATSVALNTSSAELTTGEVLQLSATVSPSNATNPAVTWNSTNSSVASVDGSGKVTAVAPGSCNIVAMTADGTNLTATCAVTVLSDVLYTEDAVGVPSGTLVLPIQLENVSAITGLQFELQLPEGVSVAEDGQGKLVAALSARAADQSISASQLSNGNYQFVVFSGTSAALSGSEGAIAYITLNVAESMATGEYVIGIKEVELTKTDGTSLHHKDLTSRLTLAEPIIGDTNGDGKVTVTDAVGIVNHVLHRTPSVFIIKAADVNGDGSITISDAVKVVNIVLNK